MLSMLLFLILLFVELTHTAFVHHQPTLVSRSSGNIYLLYGWTNEKLIREFPDTESVLAVQDILINKEVKIVSEEEFSGFSIGEKIQTLKMYAINPDEITRRSIQSVELVDPQFYRDRTVIIRGRPNLSFIRWQNETLCAWNTNHATLGGASFGWLRSNFDAIDEEKNFLGLTVGNSKDLINRMGLSYLKYYQDLRFIQLSDPNHILVSFSVFHESSNYAQFKQGYTYASIDEATNEIKIEHPMLIELQGARMHEKNYVPIAYKNDLYFIQNIYPLNVLKVRNVSFADNGDRTAHASPIAIPNVEYQLPWNTLFGSTLRGGTGALFLEEYNLYIAMFHTQGRINPHIASLATYFMGAMTMCPHPPFRTYSMSSLPIARYWAEYNGAWLSKKIDFVVFPIGIVRDPDDPRYIWISYGSQDQNSVLARFELRQLLSSMAHVKDC
jgi:hypothetical protein